jgi:hypothetical protein
LYLIFFCGVHSVNFNQFVYPGLQDPDADGKKPEKGKITYEFNEIHGFLQLGQFDCFSREIPRIHNTKHGEKMKPYDGDKNKITADHGLSFFNNLSKGRGAAAGAGKWMEEQGKARD